MHVIEGDINFAKLSKIDESIDFASIKDKLLSVLSFILSLSLFLILH